MSDDVVCGVCVHRCRLRPGQTGLCRARRNDGGQIVCANYGQLTSLALDPIEKKPLARYYPGSLILSVGSYGCNLRCPFCQNSSISTVGATGVETVALTPEELAVRAESVRHAGNIGVAYTYNEPLIGYEFVRDTAVLVRARGMKNVAVTNGCFTAETGSAVLPYLDALNIDLKGFRDDYYRMVGGDLRTVKNFIVQASDAGCHVELTTLIVPFENDSEDDMEALASWVAEAVGKDTPLHVSRFFPQHKMTDRAATAVACVYRLADVARRYLSYVYTGNC